MYHRADNPVAIYLNLLMPAVQAVNNAFLRMDQSIDLLKIVEAIRYYAAVHEGKLPESLDAIQELDVPKINPINGQPYGYHAEGNKAVVDFFVYSGGDCRMEITVE